MEQPNIEQLGKDLDRRLLDIARKVDPKDEQAIDMYADELAGDFCRAGRSRLANAARHARVIISEEHNVT